MYTYTDTLKQHLAIFQYLSLELLLGSGFPPPPSENAALPETEKRTLQGKRGTPSKGGIREIIKYSWHHFSRRELETAVCFVQRRSVGEQGQHAYTLNIWLCNVDQVPSSPLLQH